jgi:hypothetical protein
MKHISFVRDQKKTKLPDTLTSYGAFFLLIICTGLFYGYHDILFYRPVSLNVWRQTDCASVALNYYQSDMNFFHPEVHENLYAGRGYAVEELPWISYLAAVLYKLFGFHEWFYRGIVLSLFILGIFSVFKITGLVIRDTFISFIISFLLFSCPVLIYYGNNFLPNVPALALELLALWMFLKFYYQREYRYFIASIIIYVLCGLTKVSSMISYVAVMVLFVVEMVKPDLMSEPVKIFRRRLRSGFILALVAVVNFSWYMWANYFNNYLHPNHLFLVGILPIWKMTGYQINMTFNQQLYFWSYCYFFPPTEVLIVLLTIFFFIYIKYTDRIIAWITTLLLIGCLCFAALFYQVFALHDYYTICMYTYPVMLLVSCFQILKNRFPKFFYNIFFRISMAVYVVICIIYARHTLIDRYYNEFNQGYEMTMYDPHLYRYIDSLNIHRTDNVVIVNDPSPNTALYLMNLRGWTSFGKNTDEMDLKAFQSWQIKYLIVIDSNYLKRPFVQPYLKNKFGEYNGVYFMYLNPPEVNK